MNNNKTKESIREIATNLCESEQELLDLYKMIIFRNEDEIRFACACLLMACESHERKA